MFVHQLSQGLAIDWLERSFHLKKMMIRCEGLCQKQRANNTSSYQQMRVEKCVLSAVGISPHSRVGLCLPSSDTNKDKTGQGVTISRWWRRKKGILTKMPCTVNRGLHSWREGCRAWREGLQAALLMMSASGREIRILLQFAVTQKERSANRQVHIISVSFPLLVCDWHRSTNGCNLESDANRKLRASADTQWRMM